MELRPGWIKLKKHGTFYGNYFNQKCYNNKAELRVLQYKDIQSIISKIIDILNKLGRKKKFILINSPHQLIATYKNQDNQIADSYAKSTYMSVYTDIQNNKTSYFPIHEILKTLMMKRYMKNFLYINSRTKKKS